MTTPTVEESVVTKVAAPLDLLLARAAGAAGAAQMPAGSVLALGRAAARRPRRVAARAGALAGELGRIAVGASTVAPSPRDRRFADRAWRDNPWLRRLVQAYLAAGETAEGLVQDLPMEWHDAQRVRFAVTNVVDALAPSNNPFLSPVAWKAAIDTGGLSVVRGARNAVRDLSTAPRIPAMVDRSAFTVGTDLAATPGAVVLRTPVFELLRYTPTTETVRAEPLLIVPPTINKFYALDLAPGRSLVEHLVAEGQQVFVMSWRNPDSRHSKWGVDAYCQAILDAVAAVQELAGCRRTHVAAACSGGILAALTLGHLAAIGELEPVASLTLLVSVLDQHQVGTAGALVDEATAAEAVQQSRRRGYLDGRRLAEVFAWLRPNDLIWNYWVNNYLEGKQPPAFDILAWNADTTRMPARLHADFLTLALSNALVSPGGATALGSEIDLTKVDLDAYVVAGIADHLCGWQACLRSAQLLGGRTRFVLSSSGHIAALVNPPSNHKSSYAVQGVSPAVTAEQWHATAETHSGSWWLDYTAWLGERCGEQVPAPTELGSARLPVLGAAPGTYVRQS